MIIENRKVDEIYFEGNLPDDFIYAPNKNLSYDFNVLDSLGNEIFSNYDFHGYSIEYEGEFYWVNYIEDENGNIYPDIFLINPIYNLARWNLNIKSITRDLKNDKMIIEYNIQPLRHFFLVGGNENDLKIYDAIPYYLDSINIYWNSKRIFYWYFNIYYNQAKPDGYSRSYEVTGEDVYKDNTLTLVAKSDFNFNINGNKNYVKDYTQTIFIDSGINMYYDIEFIDDESVIIENPYLYNEETKTEKITFTKLFNNTYEYPQTTVDLLKLEYSDDDLSILPILNSSFYEAKININGYENNDIKIKVREENNSYIFYVDDQMYYDQSECIVKDGVTDKYINENGIVLPWDESSSGKITFTFDLYAHQPYEFNINLNIGSNNSLRGENGKYYFIEE
ncbi:MAG: hypothetical protein TYPL_2210 [Candidatus Tyloplasma litorale]|nr:MAG: hypothetical protein TYPL_2210 [Mycoplasmatales bacterium]